MTLLGEFALWISLPFALWGMVLGYAGGRTQRGDLVLSAERSVYAVFGLLVIASAGVMAAFLGDPTVGPQGKPIPTGGVRAPTRRELALTDMTVGQEGRVVRNTADTAMRSFLEEEGLGHGALVTLLAIGEDRGCLVDTGHGHAHLAAAVAEHVVVTPSS